MKCPIHKLVLVLVLLGTAGCPEQASFYSNVLRSDVFVQTYDETQFDFLFVFDNSPSMDDRRSYVRDNMQTFINILNSRKAIDYQMAVTTVDMFGGISPALPDSAGVRGNLVAASNGNTVVKSATSANPTADFASIVGNIQGTDTAFWEQGLESAYQAMFKHGSKFSRPGVPLIIVFLGDDEDFSCKDQCWGVEPEHNDHWVPYSVNRYISYFQNVKKAENTDVVAFPIVGLASGDCDVSRPGNRFIELQKALGGYGKSASVCPNSIAESFYGVARVIADRGTSFKLANLASGSGINVYIDQKLVPFTPENYLFDEKNNSIIFTGAAPKKGSVVEVAYAQKTN